jgi:hypothetical protein
VPRVPAPTALRAHLAALRAAPVPSRPAKWRRWLFGHRWVVGSLAGAMAMLCLVWSGVQRMASDPVTVLLNRAITEHAEYAQTTRPQPTPDAQAMVRAVREQVGLASAALFSGDAETQLVAGEVGMLAGRRAATFVYRDGAGRYTTLFLLPAIELVLPAESRMPIETFKPYHRVVDHRQLLLWKQGSLTCLMVSDRDQAGVASLFLRIRKSI